MKKAAKYILLFVLTLTFAFTLTACGNPPGIPGGNYVICDAEGNIAEATKAAPVFRIRGKNVKILDRKTAVFLIDKYNGNWEAEGDDGKIAKYQSTQGDWFRFKTGENWTGLPNYTYREITYDKNTKVVTVKYNVSAAGHDEAYYTKSTVPPSNDNTPDNNVPAPTG